MQQVIEFESSAKQQPIDVRATIQRKIKSVNLWLDQKSEFYSRIAEFPVTRRLVLRVNAVSLCLILAAIAVEQQPLTAITSALCAGWLVYRINKTDKNSWSLTDQEKKGANNEYGRKNFFCKPQAYK